MCGITGYIGNKKRAIQIVMSGLESLEYRGYDSAGIAYIKDKTLNIVKNKGKIINLKNILDESISSNLAIGHTRWATHGKATKKNAHPHSVGKFTIVHNGIIENYLTLKKELENIGYKFESDTDTVIACAYMDYIYKEEKDIIKTLNKVSKIFKGSYAFGIICKDDLNTLYALRKTSPLIIACAEDENYIASDVPAILKYTKNYMLLEDHEIAKINSNNITIYDENLNIIDKEIKCFNESQKEITKKHYEHFMLKEIHDEPEVWRNVITDKYENIPNLLEYKNIHIVACGTASYAGLVGKSLIEKYLKIPTIVEVASEYRYQTNFYNSETLVIFISQSGETADTLACLRKVKEEGVDTLSIVNVTGSSIARESKYVIYTKAGIEVAVASTKAYLAQVSTFANLITKFTNNIPSEETINIIANQIEETINKDYLSIAKTIYKDKKIFYIGRGIDYCLCLEGSLKLKEISYINCVAYQAGELKHGTISLIEKNTPVIAICTDDNLLEKTISNIKEVKSRGAKVIFITNNDIDGDFYDYIIKIPKTCDIYQAILTVIPLQMIAYETAKLNDRDIDKPRNLAKSVTVE